MPDKESITAIVYAAIDEVNQQLPDEEQLEKTADEVLFGREGKLDSLGVVNVIIAVQRGILDRFGARTSLVDEKAFSEKESPFRTVGMLVDYVTARLTEEGVG